MLPGKTTVDVATKKSKSKVAMEEDDLKTLAEIREAWKEIEAGKCTTMEFDDFIKEMKTW